MNTKPNSHSTLTPSRYPSTDYDSSRHRPACRWDAAWPLWRHIPDIATLQVLGFYWCNVTAADAEFIERITLGVAHPATSLPERADYPVCG